MTKVDESKSEEEKEKLDKIKGQLKGICFFVTSTTGNGTHPSSAAPMVEWLGGKLTDSAESFTERLNTATETQVAPAENESEISTELCQLR